MNDREAVLQDVFEKQMEESARAFKGEFKKQRHARELVLQDAFEMQMEEREKELRNSHEREIQEQKKTDKTGPRLEQQVEIVSLLIESLCCT